MILPDCDLLSPEIHHEGLASQQLGTNEEKDDSREDAKDAKFGGIGRYFSLRSWRLGAINFG